MNMTTKTMTPKTNLVKCPCPRCYIGAHELPELADTYRKVGKLEAEVERLHEELAKSENEVKSLRKEWRNSFLIEVAMPRWEIKKSDFDGKPYLWDNLRDDNYDLDTLCRILNEYENRLENARIILSHE